MIDAVVRLAGRLPLGVLYVFSDMLRLLMGDVVRYRRRLVERNIAGAFPEMTRRERRHTVRRFYRNLCDYIFETVKLAAISDVAMRRRLVFTNPEVIDRMLDEGRSVAVYFSHCFNWEWAPSVTLWSRHANDPGVKFCQVYRPMSNRAVDRLLLGIRSRFHSVSIAKDSVARDLFMMHRRGVLTVTGFMSDQKVSHRDSFISLPLLGRTTEVIDGTAQLAARLDMAAVYWDIERTGRGRYAITTRVLAEHPAQLPPGELTRRYVECLEETIRRDPSNWLWSHNRWKRVEHPFSRS